jgi:uncharacterized HAD superfamily protein/protein-S-isoprenylcysteine O-methyltransferase Ste14
MEPSNPNPISEEEKEKANGDRFIDFLLGEYENIAQAHFKTIDSISEFFKNYLTILSIPIPVIVVIFNLDFIKNAALNGLLFDRILLRIACLLFFVISSVGLMVYFHVLNLRWDALLYARTINGIRKYFFDHTDLLSREASARIRVLPQSTSLPIYREPEYFGPVVVAFGIFNTTYFYLFCILTRLILSGSLRFTTWWILLLSIVFGLIHYASYILLAERRENRYLRSNIIGIDVDGVLNLHRDQFCAILQKQTKKVITPNQITDIPVRKCPNLGVTGQDEISVFNDPSYWTEMPSDPKAASNLSSIKNSLQIEIHVFTSRHWPLTANLTKEDRKKKEKEWEIAAQQFTEQVYQGSSFIEKSRRILMIFWATFPYRKRLYLKIFSKTLAIDKITIAWLEKNQIKYDRLMIEKGSEYVSNPGSKTYNRFLASKIKSIKYFVEDDQLKAGKLAYICDFVFLIDQPYNRSEDLPKNVIRVNGWGDIYEWMKKLA